MLVVGTSMAVPVYIKVGANSRRVIGILATIALLYLLIAKVEIQIVRFGNPRTFRSGRMSTPTLYLIPSGV